MEPESASIIFKRWLVDNGGTFHPHAIYTQASHGLGLVAQEDIPAAEEIISCPFDLAITGPASKGALSRFLDLTETSWSVRQWICTYIVLHWIIGKDDESSHHLKHFPYLELLPPQNELLTALYFTSEELECFRGTNLYGACNDRLRDWQTEWMRCREAISKSKPTWGIQFEWTLYLVAATYLSSRAFPSTVLSQTPQLPNPESDLRSSDPVLLPGVDILNHARAQPISWITHNAPPPKTGEGAGETPKFIERVALVPHRPTAAGQEIFNNYGPKPNAELILGYGFSLSNNPDDTIILKVGGLKGAKWSLGRDSRGVEGLWKEVVKAVRPGAIDTADDLENDYERLLDASEALQEMVSDLLEKLPDPDTIVGKANIRPQVAQMFEHYVEGQSSILKSMLKFAGEKEQEAIELARSQGIELVLEDS